MGRVPAGCVMPKIAKQTDVVTPAAAVVKDRDAIFDEAVVEGMLHRSRKHAATHRRLVPRYGLHDTSVEHCHTQRTQC